MERQYKDSGIQWVGFIPKKWRVLRNKNTFVLVKDLIGNKSSETQLLSLTTMGIKAIKQGDTTGKVPESYDTYQIVNPNNLVMCLFDLDCSAVFAGISSYYGMISPAYKVLTCKTIMNPQYANYWFSYVFVGRKYKNYSKNVRYSLTYEEFSALSVLVPPINEQQRIASYLDKKCGEIDELIALQEKMIAHLTEYKQAVITETVTKGLDPNAKLVPSGIEWIGEIPEKWKWIKLGLIFQFKGGYAFDSNKYVTNSNNQVIRIGNVKNDQLLLDVSPVFVDDETAELAKNYKLKDGYILFTMTGTKGKRDYFYTLMLDEKDIDRDLYLNQRVGCLIAKKGIYPFYYNYLLKDKMILDRIFLFETGTANQGNLGYESISRTILQLPPYEEQVSIAKYINERCYEIDALIAKKHKKIEILKEYKKSIIYEAVTGKIDIFKEVA